MTCNPLPFWDNMNLSSSDTAYGARVEAQCEEGYKFKGFSETTTITTECSQNAEWVPALQSCISKS